jgi:pimeloyl-ACP methyl ester carboxylesterase
VEKSKAYVSVRGSQIYYETLGKGEPVVLLHGGFGTNEDFASQIPELAKHFKVVAFERPGHGHTADNGEPFHYSTMAEYTVGFIEALGLNGANLVGWSDGTIVALLVAISRPDLVKRLICISGNFDANGLKSNIVDWIRTATPESFRKDASDFVRRYEEATPDGPAHYPTVFEKTMKMWLAEPKIGKEELARITAPTLVMGGDRDMIAPEHLLEEFKSIKGAQMCIIPGSTHMLLSEKPEDSNRAILEFLLQQEKPK